ncbi:hypothetical protein J2S78_002752 [Salibacterium salarium]|uniref:hypothetical protein n=1 Tax=Salibacterium salarium TaxID=284579 RepID=UPI0027844143|nr:hypothetical protein [Salibacterium salarium]MDQ0300305.1 hypothetical protein [Salibacterium salarium]
MLTDKPFIFRVVLIVPFILLFFILGYVGLHLLGAMNFEDYMIGLGLIVMFISVCIYIPYVWRKSQRVNLNKEEHKGMVSNQLMPLITFPFAFIAFFLPISFLGNLILFITMMVFGGYTVLGLITNHQNQPALQDLKLANDNEVFIEEEQLKRLDKPSRLQYILHYTEGEEIKTVRVIPKIVVEPKYDPFVKVTYDKSGDVESAKLFISYTRLKQLLAA